MLAYKEDGQILCSKDGFAQSTNSVSGYFSETEGILKFYQHCHFIVFDSFCIQWHLPQMSIPLVSCCGSVK